MNLYKSKFIVKNVEVFGALEIHGLSNGNIAEFCKKNQIYHYKSIMATVDEGVDEAIANGFKKVCIQEI